MDIERASGAWARKAVILCLTGMFSNLVYEPHGYSQTPGIFLIRGIPKTCQSISEIDRATAARDSHYFFGWTRADYDDAVRWAAACVNYGFAFAGPYRIQALRSIQNTFAQQDANQRTHVQNQAALQTQRNAYIDQQVKIVEDQRLKKEQQEAHAAEVKACHLTPQYQLFDAQERVIGDRESRKSTLDDLAKERKISQVSGVQNLSRKYADGSALVQIDDDARNDWKEYKSLGGRAKSANSISHLIENPCPDY